LAADHVFQEVCEFLIDRFRYGAHDGSMMDIRVLV
jgi:hypothetical protein